MMNPENPLVLIAGYRTGFERVAEELQSLPARLVWLPEDQEGVDFPHDVACVLLLFDADTIASSQLLSLFTYLRDHVTARSRLIVELEQFRDDGTFLHVRQFERIPLRSLRKHLETALGAA